MRKMRKRGKEKGGSCKWSEVEVGGGTEKKG